MVGSRRFGHQRIEVAMDIELASKTIGRIRKTGRVKWFFNKIIIWGSFGLTLLLITIAFLNLWAGNSNEILNSRIKAREKEIEASSKIENQQLYLNSKLASFGTLIKTHELHQAIAETVFSLIPSGTSLKGFEVTETGLITISGTVPSWQLLSRLLSNLEQPASPLTVSRYKIKEVNFSGAGDLSFTLELSLKI